MVRVVYKIPAWSQAGMITILALWSALYAYIVWYTHPPAAIVGLFLLPAIALIWTLRITSRPVVWEPNETGLWKHVGRESSLLIDWREVASLVVRGRPGSNNVFLVVRRKDRGRSIRIVAGAGIDRDGVRTLYEASAFYLKSRGISGENPFGWRDILPLVVTKPTKGARFNWILHSGVDALIAGVVILASVPTRAAGPLLVGLPLTAGGALIILGAKVRARKPIQSPEPRYRVNE